MNTVHPTILSSLSPYIGSMGMFTNNPVADAAKHFDAQVDNYFTQTIEYIGIELEVEVCVHSRRASQIFSVGGDDLYYEFSDHARDRIARKAIAESGVEL